MEDPLQTSRFQLGLIATLAVGLGFSLASSEAIGYPAGAAVSMGSNPVWSIGGSSLAAVSISAPEDQDLVITDFMFGTNASSNAVPRIERSDGTILAHFLVWGYGSSHDNIAASMASGVRVPAGETVTLHGGGTSVYYTLSGYYVQP